MKIRQCFVSNSSSSSFIMGLAKVTDQDTLNESLLMDDKNIFAFKPNTQPPGVSDWVLEVNEDSVSMSSFTDEFVTLSGLKKGDFVTWFDGRSGPNGDDWFADEDGWGSDYGKIDLNDFSEKDQEMYNKLASLGGDVLYGAGRNG